MTARPKPGSLVSQLHALAGKYTTLVALRRQRETLEARGILRLEGNDAASRRARCRQVASAFPGALRELEALSAEVLEQRLRTVRQELAAAHRHPRRRLPIALWLRLILSYHARLREALAIRRWLHAQSARHRGVDAALVARCAAWYQTLAPHRSRHQSVDAAFVQRHLRPPEGKLNALIWHDLASQYRRRPEQVRQLLFGPP